MAIADEPDNTPLAGTVFTPRQVRALKIAVIVMGILLVGGFAFVLAAIVYQASKGGQEGAPAAVLGGIGTLWGPVLGAVILIPLTELTRSYIGGSGRGVDLIVYGVVIVLISLARPQGLVGLFTRQKKAVPR